MRFQNSCEAVYRPYSCNARSFSLILGDRLQEAAFCPGCGWRLPHDRIRDVGRQNPIGRLADDVFVLEPQHPEVVDALREIRMPILHDSGIASIVRAGFLAKPFHAQGITLKLGPLFEASTCKRSPIANYRCCGSLLFSVCVVECKSL